MGRHIEAKDNQIEAKDKQLESLGRHIEVKDNQIEAKDKQIIMLLRQYPAFASAKETPAASAFPKKEIKKEENKQPV